jgi:TnpA family transposase
MRGIHGMKRQWADEELVEHWELLPDEMELTEHKPFSHRLLFATLLKFFQLEGRFPRLQQEVPRPAVTHLAKQLGLQTRLLEDEWHIRTTARFHEQIRALLGFREAGVEDMPPLSAWLIEHVLQHEQEFEAVRAHALKRLRALHIEPPTSEQLDRLLHSALHSFEQSLFAKLHSRLSVEIQNKLDALATRVWQTTTADAAADAQSASAGEQSQSEGLGLSQLRMDPGRVGLDSILQEVDKLRAIQDLALPNDLFVDVHPKWVERLAVRASAETLHELRRHPASIRHSLLAALCQQRALKSTDSLVELLMGTVHRIGKRAEKRVDAELAGQVRQVANKNGLLCRLAEAALGNPDGIVREVIYPVVSPKLLQDLVNELKATGPAYREAVHQKMCSSYGNHYRRALPKMLEVLQFCSNNEQHQPVIQALALLDRHTQSRARYFPLEETVPLDGVIRPSQQELLIHTDEKGRQRIPRLGYELYVLQTLRDKLRCKEVWVQGAERYRNPDEDLPIDFETSRVAYYQALDQPLVAEEFISTLQKQMTQALQKCDAGIPKNTYVQLSERGGGWISLTPSAAQAPPVSIASLKLEVARRWPMTPLIDILKEADLRLEYSSAFKGTGVRENIDRATLRRRLLLCLFGLGTNTGLKRIGNGSGETDQDLLYVRRRYINRNALRQAITDVANATFAVRSPQIWGEGTAACASDSKKFGAWDQNLMTEWHVRYGGRGVMIYWHVEKKSACIYSQLKSCSSSEAAAMLHGLLRHETDLQIKKNYVDTHGQSEVAFAFCHLLGFQLMPRLKNLHAQKLYLPRTGEKETYANLKPILTRSINWELIRQQYDEMVKYATALRLGTAEPDAILRRFNRSNLQHPTYQALLNWAKPSRPFSSVGIWTPKPCARRFMRGLTLWNPGTEPTVLSFMARVVR